MKKPVDPMTHNYQEYVDGLPLLDALWWFIENGNSNKYHTDYFFSLRERMKDNESKVLVCGNPESGFKHYGPFETADQASDWADKHEHSEAWWIIDLESEHASD